MEGIGRRRWAIAEGYLPAGSHGPAPQMTSHETVCILNTSDQQADVRITIFYADRGTGWPLSGHGSCPAHQTRSIQRSERPCTHSDGYGLRQCH